MTTGAPFDLERFVTAQAPIFSAVLAELRASPVPAKIMGRSNRVRD